MESLYHTEIGLPPGFTAPTHKVEINYGGHAKQEAMQDRYGKIRLPKSLTLSRMRVIEVGIDHNAKRITKILFRGDLDETRDLCIVLIPNSNGPWKCKTVWVNVKSDLHKTLDRSRYVC